MNITEEDLINADKELEKLINEDDEAEKKTKESPIRNIPKIKEPETEDDKKTL